MLAREYVHANEPMSVAALRYLREQLTEERTDRWIDATDPWLDKVKMPRFVPRFMVKKVLDWLVPDKALDWLEVGLRRVGALPSPNASPGFLDNKFHT